MDMNGREKETLGAYLRREREVRRVEKELMFKEAKIAFPLLTALEEDNWDAFPSRKEIPAYLKRYCRFLLLDEEAVLRRYALQPPKRVPPVADTAPAVADDAAPREAAIADILPTTDFGRKKPPMFTCCSPAFTWAFLVAMVIAFLGLYLNFFHPLYEQDAAEKISRAESVVVPPPATPAVPAAAGRAKIVGDRETKRYHLPGMREYDLVAIETRVEFDSEDAAVKAGYRKSSQ